MVPGHLIMKGIIRDSSYIHRLSYQLVADVEALVGAIDHHGVLGEAELGEGFLQRADTVVHPPYATQVVLGVALVLPAHQGIAAELGLVKGLVPRPVGGTPVAHLPRGHALQVAPGGLVKSSLDRIPFKRGGQVDEVVKIKVHVPVDLEFLVARGRCVVFPLVEQGRGLGHLDIIVQVKVACRGHPVPVRGLVLYHQHEGLTGVTALFQEVHRHVGDEIGAIPLDGNFTFRGDEIRVVVEALAGQYRPGIVSLGLSLEVGLAVDGCLVPGLLQELGEGLLVPVEAVPVVHEAVLVAVLPGLDDRPAGPADGIGAEAPLEEHPLRGEPVDMRGGVDRFQPAVVGPNRMRCVVIAENEYNVGLLCRCGHEGEAAKKDGYRFHESFSRNGCRRSERGMSMILREEL